MTKFLSFRKAICLFALTSTESAPSSKKWMCREKWKGIENPRCAEGKLYCALADEFFRRLRRPRGRGPQEISSGSKGAMPVRAVDSQERPQRRGRLSPARAQ